MLNFTQKMESRSLLLAKSLIWMHAVKSRYLIVSVENWDKFKEEEAETWAHENNLPFLETSAKNDYNVERIFSKLAVDIYNRINDGRLVSSTTAYL